MSAVEDLPSLPSGLSHSGRGVFWVPSLTDGNPDRRFPGNLAELSQAMERVFAWETRATPLGLGVNPDRWAEQRRDALFEAAGDARLWIDHFTGRRRPWPQKPDTLQAAKTLFYDLMAEADGIAKPDGIERPRGLAAAVAESDVWPSAARKHPPENAVAWLGDRVYRVGTHRPVVVTDSEHEVLQAFLASGHGCLDQSMLREACKTVDDAPRVIRELASADRYDGSFAPAIRRPMGKGQGGYYVPIRDESFRNG